MTTAVTGRVELSPEQRGHILENVVARIRGTIESRDDVPLSLDPNSVPPEGWQHAIVLTVNALVAAQPGIGFVLKEAFDKMVERAEEWLLMIARSEIGVTYPVEPIEAEASDGGLVRWTSDSRIETAAI